MQTVRHIRSVTYPECNAFGRRLSYMSVVNQGTPGIELHLCALRRKYRFRSHPAPLIGSLFDGSSWELESIHNIRYFFRFRLRRFERQFPVWERLNLSTIHRRLQTSFNPPYCVMPTSTHTMSAMKFHRRGTADEKKYSGVCTCIHPESLCSPLALQRYPRSLRRV